MITPEVLAEYEKMAKPYIKDFVGLELNHIAIGASSKKEYEDLKEKFAPCLSEVTFHGRRIATARFGNFLLELLEPKPDQRIKETSVDHIGYTSNDFEGFIEKFSGKVTARFDVGSTHGIKFSPVPGLTIEIRNNHILDSLKDFSS